MESRCSRLILQLKLLKPAENVGKKQDVAAVVVEMHYGDLWGAVLWSLGGMVSFFQQNLCHVMQLNYCNRLSVLPGMENIIKQYKTSIEPRIGVSFFSLFLIL